jgi:hypothetical protein
MLLCVRQISIGGATRVRAMSYAVPAERRCSFLMDECSLDLNTAAIFLNPAHDCWCLGETMAFTFLQGKVLLALPFLKNLVRLGVGTKAHAGDNLYPRP